MEKGPATDDGYARALEPIGQRVVSSVVKANRLKFCVRARRVHRDLHKIGVVPKTRGRFVEGKKPAHFLKR